MKKVLILDGSTRKNGNTSYLVEKFKSGASQNNAQVNHILVKDLNIRFCNGCLRCNLIKRCAISNDDWMDLSNQIKESDVLVFASPIYFHYVTAPLKSIIDRFRSFVHVQITEDGVRHTPWEKWNKEIVLLMSMGSSDPIDSKPVVDLFDYMCEVLGDNNLHCVKATRLAVTGQIIKSESELEKLYPKLKIDTSFIDEDLKRNKKLLEESHRLGDELTQS